MKIAVVGAPSTGKTTLVLALRLALLADADTVDCAVTEDWAPEHHRGDHLTLLMGLDLPRHGALNDPDLLQSDARLRYILCSQAITYTVVYGSGQVRTDCALQAIAYHRRRSAKRPSPTTSGWHWNCETCSDAACEHLLFSALVKKSDSVRL